MTYGIPYDGNHFEFCTRGHYLADTAGTDGHCRRCDAILQRGRRPTRHTGLIPRPPEWARDVPCQDDPEAFFPSSGDADTMRRAKATCATCPMLNRCLDYALALPPSADVAGVWGGLSAIERRRIRHDRKAAS